MRIDIIKRRAFIFIIMVIIFALAGQGLKGFTRNSRVENWLIIRPPHEVSTLVCDGDIIWAGGRDGVYKVDRLQKRVISKLELESELSYVKALLIDENGDLWIGQEKGLIRYNRKESYYYGENEGLPDENVNALLSDEEGRLWVGTWGGAACYDGENWNIYKMKDGLAHDAVNVMYQDSHGGMWFGSYAAPDGGLTYYNGNDFYTYNTESILPHNNICAIFEDNHNDIWVGTGFYTRGGAVRLSLQDGKPLFKDTWSKQDGLAGDKVRSIFQDSTGVYWFGSEYDGIVRWDDTSKQVYTKKNGMSGNEVKVWLEDKDGSLWLGTDDGITVIPLSAVNAD